MILYYYPYAFMLGLASLASPCSIITIPTLLAQSKGDRSIVITFAAGFAVSVFALVLATILVGKLFSATYGFYAYMLAGIITSIAGFSMLGILPIPSIPSIPLIPSAVPLSFSQSSQLPQTSLFSMGQKVHHPFLSGLLMGGVSLTCVGPALAGLLALAITVQAVSLKLAVSAIFVLGSITPFALFFIGLSGKRATRYFQDHAKKIHRISAMVMLAVSAFMVSVGLHGVIG